MDIIEEEGLIENAKVIGKLLLDEFKEMMKSCKILGDVRGRGLMIGLELVKDKKTKAYGTEEAAQLMDICKEKGLLLGKGGLFGNVIRIAPPLSINKEEAQLLLKVVGEALVTLDR
jgi:4-aminobutyrate aminotransferase-like enzyme